jgi:hypothetical protein
MGFRSRRLFSLFAAVPAASGMVAFGVLALGLDGCGEDNPGGPADVIPPRRVVDLRVQQQSATTALLRWTAPGDDEAEGRAASYDARRAPFEITISNWPTTVALPGLQAPQPAGQPESLRVSGLAEGVRTYFALRALDDAGNESRMSNQIDLTIDVTPPGAADSLTVEDVRSTTVRLAWKASGDDGDIGRAERYDLRYALAAINEANWPEATRVEGEVVPLDPGFWQVFVVSGLVPATSYWFALKAEDEAGNQSPLSDVVQATTLP